MAKEAAAVHRFPKSHKVASGLKPGESMVVHFKRLEDDEASEGDDGTYPMEEESSHIPPPPPAAPSKKKDPIETIKEKRAQAK